MAPIDDETLDRLLTGHLSARLDGYLGRAEPAFRRRLAEAGLAAMDAGSAATANDVAPLRLVPPDPGLAGTDDAADHSASPPLRLRPAARPPAWPAGWLWAAAGTALAAAVATVFVLPQAGTRPGGDDRAGGSFVASRPAPSPGGTGGPGAVRQPTVRYVHNRTWDEGTYAPGPTAAPVRRVRHQHVEHLRFFDADRGAWVEVTVPSEDVELYELDTY